MKNHPLENIKWGVIPVTCYRGRLVTKSKNGYWVSNKFCPTLKKVDEVINNAEKAIEKSIK